MDASRDELAKLVDWSKFNQPTGEASVDRSTATPIEHRTASPLVNITRGDIANAIDKGLAFSGGGLGIKAYHGSPHDFNQFDLSKIGTGEGAQAYGHGLYFAEHEPVAKSYRDALAARQNTAEVQAVLDKFGGDPQKAAAYLRQQAPEGSALARHYEDVAQKVETGAPLRGRMYEVDINAKPEHFLDWDKPAGEQSTQIKDIMRSSGIHPSAMPDLPTGLVAGRRLQDPSSMLLKNLDEAGIPGIKYLDQGSRAAANLPQLYPGAKKLPPPTSNYVVRNADIIKIMRKYGLAGAAPVGLGALATGNRED